MAVAVAQAFMRTIRGRSADTPAPSTSPPPAPSSSSSGNTSPVLSEGDANLSSRRRSSPVPPPSDRPLTLSSATIGLVAASHHTFHSIHALPRSSSPLRAALQSLKLTAQLAYKWLRRVESAPSLLPFPERLALLDVDAVVVLLAEAAAAVSETGDLLVGVVEEAARAGAPVAEVLPAWAPALVGASERMERVEHLLSKLLTILQISSVAEATSARSIIDAALPLILGDNEPLAASLHSMPDVFSARSLVAPSRLAAILARPPPIYSAPTSTATPAAASDPSSALPPDYSAATASDAPHPDGSVTIRPAGWSVFASLTLADLPALSRVPLPLCAAELRYGELYTNEFAQRVGPRLAEVMEGPGRAKAAQLAEILGSRSDALALTDEQNFARRVGMELENRVTTRDGRPRLRPQPNLLIGGS